jgi:hypothetical protein
MNLRASLSQWIVLATAGGASFYGAHHLSAPDAVDDAVEPIVRAASAQPVAAPRSEPAPTTAAMSRSATPEREAIHTTGEADAFKGRSWTPPPPPAPPPAPAVQAPPPAPSAPPLPFRFVGLLENHDDQPTAFLARGDALHVVRAGDQIDGVYRVDALSATKVVLTYLPLKQQQILSVTGAER